MNTARFLLVLCVTLAVAAQPGCGKKGPPLAPEVRLPERAMDLAARRVGDTVQLQFTIPSANIDGSTPADLARVDIYAYTALAPGDIRDVRDMTRIGSVAVRRPPEPAEAPERVDAPDARKPAKPAKPAKPPKPPEPGEDQGAKAGVTDALTPEMATLTVPSRKPVPPPVEMQPRTWFDTPLVPPLTGPVLEPKPTRFYVAYGVNHDNQRGGASPRVPVVLDVAPPAEPGTPTLTVTEKAIVLTWPAPAGAALPVQEPVLVAPAPAPPVASATAGAAPPPAGAVPPKAGAAPLAAGQVPTPAGAAPPAAGAAPPPAGAVPPRAGAAPPALRQGPPPAGAAPLAAGAAPATLAAAQGAVVAEATPQGPLPAYPRGMLLPILPAYNVYLAPAPTAGPRPAAPTSVFPVPLNAQPLDAATFGDAAFEFGVERCYEVRTVNTVGALARMAPATSPVGVGGVSPAPAPVPAPVPGQVFRLESAPSTRVCVTPVDTFPPPAPSSLVAVPSDGAISLIWNGVDAPDLGGYLVLRGEGPDGPLTPLFDAPIGESSYRDATARPGVRYVYAVVALDRAAVPNRSALSNKVEERAR